MELSDQIDINHWSFQSLDLINNCQRYYSLNKLSKIKDTLFHPLIKTYISSKSLLQFENNLRNTILSKLNVSNHHDFTFIMTPGYCCGSEDCYEYLTQFNNNKNESYSYMNWPQTFEFWLKCMNNNNSKIQIILTPQIGKLILLSSNNLFQQIQKQKVNDFHCRLILLIIIPTNTKTKEINIQNHFECIYSIYDCNGTEINLYQLIRDEYNITNNDLIKYPFLYHIKHNTISLNGIGYYMNQWIKFYTDQYNEKSIGSCYFFILWSSISVLIACVFNKKELLTKCKEIAKESKGISFQFQTNAINFMKRNIIRLLNYDIQRLVLSKLIIDARSELLYKVTPSEFQNLSDENGINKEARTKQTARKRTGPKAPRKQTTLYTPRRRKQINKYKMCIGHNNKMTSTIDYIKLSQKHYYKLLKMTSKYRYKSFCSKLL